MPVIYSNKITGIQAGVTGEAVAPSGVKTRHFLVNSQKFKRCVYYTIMEFITSSEVNCPLTLTNYWVG